MRSSESAAPGHDEHELAQLLGPLAADGWHFLFDRVNPNGANIDAIAVGPAGVVVIDNRAWNGVITVDGSTLKVGGYSKPAVLATLTDAVTAVAAALTNPGDEIDIIGVITFTTQPDVGPFALDAVQILGVHHLVHLMATSPAKHTAATVERFHATLAQAFPKAGTVPSKTSGFVAVENTELGWYLSNATTLYYARPWKKSGRNHVYLNDPSGQRLGVRDLRGDTTTIEPNVDDPLARFVLDHITATGIVGDPELIPKVVTDFPMGKAFGQLSKLWRAAIVGMEWRKPAKHYLYGTLVQPGAGIVRLGHVDLTTGFVKPEETGELLDGATTAEQLLAILRDNRPRRA